MSELKPCPFCGGKVKIDVYNYTFNYLETSVRIIHKCNYLDIKIFIEEIVGFKNEKEIEKAKRKITDKWNERISDE